MVCTLDEIRFVGYNFSCFLYFLIVFIYLLINIHIKQLKIRYENYTKKKKIRYEKLS